METRQVDCFVDLGTGAEPNYSTPVAGEALVFMVDTLDCSWKLSIGYFLIGYLNADKKVNILAMAFRNFLMFTSKQSM
jgi:hypothetical protein